MIGEIDVNDGLIDSTDLRDDLADRKIHVAYRGVVLFDTFDQLRHQRLIDDVAEDLHWHSVREEIIHLAAECGGQGADVAVDGAVSGIRVQKNRRRAVDRQFAQ